MGLRMATPWKHPDSGIFWLRRRVPADLVALVGRREEKLSLRTRDPAEAKVAYIRVAAEVEARWANLRKGTRRISHKEATAIAGEFYHKLIHEKEDDPGDTASALNAALFAQVAADSPGVKVITTGDSAWVNMMLSRIKEQNRPAVEAYLKDRGEIVDEESFGRILAAVNVAMDQGRGQILRFARGDYRPDPDAGRFPVRESGDAKGPDDTPAEFYNLVTIYEKFAEESKHAMSTRKKWRAIIAEVAMDNADIRQISELWCVAWKDRLLARGLSPRSIQYGYLAALRSTCGWAVKNKRITKNPVEGIGVKVAKARENGGAKLVHCSGWIVWLRAA